MNYYIKSDIDQITENIYLGNYEASINPEYLSQIGITKILSVMDVGAPNYNEFYNGPYFIQKIVKVVDYPTENIIKYFGECINFIFGYDKVLVHCSAGASRSATIVIAYIMWSKRMPYEKALYFVSDKRYCVCPNLGFREQLQLFDKLLKENNYNLNLIDFQNIKWDKKITDYYEDNFDII